MSKGNRFGKSIGDLLLEAMANKQGAGQEEGVPLSKKKMHKLQDEIKETYKAPPKTATASPCDKSIAPRKTKTPTKRGPSQAKRPVIDKLFYNALKRSPEEIREEFSRQSTSLSKRKGMIEGVAHAYYALQNKDDRSPASQQKILLYQDLLAELKEEIKVISNTEKTSTKPQSKPLPTKAPTRTKSTTELFSTKSQFDDQSAGSGFMDVVIGLDFGTACSKIVVRTPYERNLAYLVPFGDFSHSSNRHLLPTHISAANGAYCLPKTGKIGRYDNLKLRFIESLTKFDENDNSEFNATAYLALVFQYVRGWFLQTCRENYPGKSLIWKVNIGVPSSTAENDDVCQLYERAVMVAWTHSMRNQSISAQGIDTVKRDYQAGDVTEDEIVDVKIYPEVAAEVIGYTQSDLRQEGLHLMMDVGAGTLDLCGFNVHQHDDENVLPIFSTNVEPHGVKSLHQGRCDAISLTVTACHDKLVQDVVAPMSHELDSYIPRQHDFEQGVQAAEARLASKCKAQLQSIILDLKNRMDPRSDRWRNQLPLFLCGGGSMVPFYKALVEAMSEWMKTQQHSRGIRFVALPRPEALADFVDEENFHRFGVAWGLSHSPYDFDRVMTNLAPVYTDNFSREEQGGWWERPISYWLMDD